MDFEQINTVHLYVCTHSLTLTSKHETNTNVQRTTPTSISVSNPWAYAQHTARCTCDSSVLLVWTRRAHIIHTHTHTGTMHFDPINLSAVSFSASVALDYMLCTTYHHYSDIHVDACASLLNRAQYLNNLFCSFFVVVVSHVYAYIHFRFSQNKFSQIVAVLSATLA